ncbi:MAG TPA: SMC-Scp complex subunit ScpB [Patescibacteria group bacterium]|nr:SMC-Scp complex subunit ScpB [Patescibacteria group bacterium]
MFYRHLKGPIEALLFANGNPLPAAKLALLLNIDEENVQLLLAEMAADMAGDGRGLMLQEVAGGYQLCTKPELVDTVNLLVTTPESRLSSAAMETLAIIAFKQPITRQEMEAIRGVKVDGVVTTLLERGLIREAGRKEAVGRPILYITTDVFLQCFGLNTLQDLPALSQFLPDPDQPS